jgi:DNA invertase Pin-like site-specific DNA recombinase
MKQQAIYQKNQKITALYCRLSRDDGTQDDSSSIQTQKAMLNKYASDHGYRNTRFFVDDGYSGTNFNRPAFQEMISEVEANRVERVITKDLSRLGRNYLETGSYIEVFFPNHHVQYIAINDGVDSTSYQSMDITPFKNILNELYAADVSKKVRSAMKTRAENGQFTGSSAPYGYRKDPADHNHLVIDERYAPVVRRIFQWAQEGAGIPTIRNRLREEKIPRPSAVSTMNYSRFEVTEEKAWEWSNNSVRNILRNPTYSNHQKYQQ